MVPTIRKSRTEDDVALKELGLARSSGHSARCRRAEDAVIVRFLSMSAAVAHKYTGRGVEADDLEQVARMGLVKAVHRWQPDRGPFLPFAVPTVEGEIKRYFRDYGSFVRVPRTLYESQPGVSAVTSQLWQENARVPATDEIASLSGFAEERVREIQTARTRCRPISTDVLSSIDQFPSSDAECDLLSVDLRTQLRPILAALTERERTIVALRFVWGQSQAEIAAVIGLSQMQVCRLLRALLAKLRKHLTDTNEPNRLSGTGFAGRAPVGASLGG